VYLCDVRQGDGGIFDYHWSAYAQEVWFRGPLADTGQQRWPELGGGPEGPAPCLHLAYFVLELAL
jgi:hypothetical protein